MDCEKFDQCVMDALYGELDELTLAAVKRHVEGCARCGAAWASLKATRNGTILPLEEPSAELEQRILAAERAAHGHAPWHRKLLRAAAWAGSHAMRPQLAMAALFMFVITSSLLLLRARPGTMAPPVQVSEQGRPESAAAERKEESDDEPAAKKRKAGVGRSDESLEERAKSDADRPAAAAPAAATAAASAGPAGDAGATLADALALRDKSGCSAAMPALEGVAKNRPGEAKLAEQALAACRQEDSTSQPAAPSPAASGSASATSTSSNPP